MSALSLNCRVPRKRSSSPALLLGLALLFVAHLALVTSARAEEDGARTAVLALVDEAKQDFESKAYSQASLKLDIAFRILPTASVGLWSARALEKEGKLSAADKRYLEAENAPVDPSGDKDQQESARVAARAERAALQKRTAQVVVRLLGTNERLVSLQVVQSEPTTNSDGGENSSKNTSESSGDASVAPPSKKPPSETAPSAKSDKTGTRTILLVVRQGEQVLSREVELDESGQVELDLTLERARLIPNSSHRGPYSGAYARRDGLPIDLGY